MRNHENQRVFLGQQYMPALTGIRAIAAYMVCFHHYNPLNTFKNTEGWKKLAFNTFNEMHIGVSIFFVLSGFLICYRYYNVGLRVSGQWFKQYMLNRFARIYPMFFILSILTFVLIIANPERYELVKQFSGLHLNEKITVALLNLTMFKGFFNEYKYSGIAQGWSLTVEECFYICAPFIIILVKKNKSFQLILPVITLLVGFGLVFVFGRFDIHGFFQNVPFMLNFTFFGRCLEFFAGMALAIYIHERGIPATTQFPWRTAVGCVTLIACLVGMASIGGVEISKDTYLGIIINNAVLPVAIYVLFYGLIAESTWLRTILSTSTFNLLGKSSYVFYLVHTGVINILIRTYMVHNSAVQFVLLIIVSILLYKFIETPLHKMLRPKPTKVAALFKQRKLQDGGLI